jgi:hypothetical protein
MGAVSLLRNSSIARQWLDSAWQVQGRRNKIMDESEFIEALKSGLKKIGKEKRGNKTEWTAAIKTTLVEIAEIMGISSNSHIDSFPNKYHCHENVEWLYDAVLYKATNQGIEEIWLVAESEWSRNHDDLFWDFSKLLIAKSKFHLMVFDPPSGKYDEYLQEFKDYIRESKICSECDETYLFAAYLAENDEQLKFSKFINKKRR